MLRSFEYYYTQILIHRPWTSRRSQLRPTQRQYYKHARQMCIESACEMARISRGFETACGYRNLDVETSQMLPSAALILIFAATTLPQPDTSGQDVITHLNTLLRAMDEQSNTHLSAREQLENVLLVRERWQKLNQRQLAKRRAGAPPHSLGGPSKRHRTA